MNKCKECNYFANILHRYGHCTHPAQHYHMQTTTIRENDEVIRPIVQGHYSCIYHESAEKIRQQE